MLYVMIMLYYAYVMIRFILIALIVKIKIELNNKQIDMKIQVFLQQLENQRKWLS